MEGTRAAGPEAVCARDAAAGARGSSSETLQRVCHRHTATCGGRVPGLGSAAGREEGKGISDRACEVHNNSPQQQTLTLQLAAMLKRSGSGVRCEKHKTSRLSSRSQS